MSSKPSQNTPPTLIRSRIPEDLHILPNFLIVTDASLQLAARAHGALSRSPRHVRSACIPQKRGSYSSNSCFQWHSDFDTPKYPARVRKGSCESAWLGDRKIACDNPEYARLF